MKKSELTADLNHQAGDQRCLVPTESVLTAGSNTVHVHAMFHFDVHETTASACQLQVECLSPVMQVQFAAASICKLSWNTQTAVLNTDDAPAGSHSAAGRILTNHSPDLQYSGQLCHFAEEFFAACFPQDILLKMFDPSLLFVLKRTETSLH